MSDKIDYLKGQTMPGVGCDGPLNINLQVQVPQNMVNDPGLWQQFFSQLKDVYPVDWEADQGKVLAVEETTEGNDLYKFKWIDVIHSISAGEGIDVDVTDKNNPIVSVKLSADDGNSIEIGTDGGVFSNKIESGAGLVETESTGVITFDVVISADSDNAIVWGSDDFLYAPKVTVNGITQDAGGNITLGPEDIGEYGVVPFGPSGSVPVDPADIGENGVPELDVNGKIPLDSIPEALLGAVNYQGTWEASTNTPALPTAAPENKGWYFVATDSGTWNGIDFTLGDWVISNGTAWDKIDTLDSVVSVNGKQGAVTITAADVGLGNVNNTSDAAKPISTATQTALNSKADATLGNVTQANARTKVGTGTMAYRNVTISTAAPSGGADGDVWLRYV